MTLRFPDVLFVGPAKTGTTWIHEYLSGRPCVALPRTNKETFFFDRYADRGFDWYKAQFADLSDETMRIEVAPSYSDFPETASRIAAALPDVQIVLTFRDPVARTISQYWHWRRYGLTNEPIERLIDANPLLLRPSRYSLLLEHWRSIFGRERIAYLFFDDLSTDPLGFADKLCATIGIPPAPPSDMLLQSRINEGAVPVNSLIAQAGAQARRFLIDNDLGRVIRFLRLARLKSLFERPMPENIDSHYTAELRSRLYGLLEDDIRALERQTGRALPSWHAAGAQ